MTIIAIIGPSGAGKDTVAKILSEHTLMPILISYTTRPMRDGETNGVEHIFVPSFPGYSDDILTYTQYGGHHYWTQVSDILTAQPLGEHHRTKDLSEVEGGVIYVIDEEGYDALRRRHPEINIITINVRASVTVRRARGVSIDRIHRDESRRKDITIHYNFVINNNHLIPRLRRNISYIAHKIKQIMRHP